MTLVLVGLYASLKSLNCTLIQTQLIPINDESHLAGAASREATGRALAVTPERLGHLTWFCGLNCSIIFDRLPP